MPSRDDDKADDEAAMGITPRRSHPLSARGLGSVGSPWVTMLVAGAASVVLALMFLTLERNWRAAPISVMCRNCAAAETRGEYWYKLSHSEYESQAGRKVEPGGGGASAASAQQQLVLSAAAAAATENAALPANVVDTRAGGAVSVSGGGGGASAGGGGSGALAGIPVDCGAEENLDLDGPAVSWGLNYKTATAAECCAACKEHKQKPGEPGDCNSWVWCPEPECWSPDIWNHTLHECWLKVQADPANPVVNRRGAFEPEFRAIHKTAPEKTPWMAGVLKGRSG